MKQPSRKPKPTYLKILDGEKNKDRINPNEIKPKIQIPTCPSHLNAIAKKEWGIISKLLFDLGALSNIDRAALAVYCVLYARWVNAEKVLNRTSDIIKTKDGNLIQNPALAISNKAVTLMYKYLIEFGMTPSSRTRVAVKPKAPGRQERPKLNR